MTQKSSSRPRIRSREERESEASRLASSDESGDSVAGPAVSVADAGDVAGVPLSPVEASVSPDSNGLVPEELTPKELAPEELTPKELTPKGLTPEGLPSGVGVDAPLPGVDDIRRMAQAEGFALSRERGPRKFRPDPDARGGVRMTCRISSPVRMAMELARMDMNVSYSEIMEVAISLYLESRGFPVDSLSKDAQVPVRG